MENQHRKITGYRELTQAEIDLMNKIKAHAEATNDLIVEVRKHLSDQNLAAVNATLGPSGTITEQSRLQHAEPGRWASLAKTDLQTGLMALTRAVAQPTTF